MPAGGTHENPRLIVNLGKFKLNLLPIRGYYQIKCFPKKWIWTYFGCSHNDTFSYH